MNRALILIFLSLAAAGAAAAQSGAPNEMMTARALKSELFGVRLSGIELSTGERWSECIEPTGRTFYEFAGNRFEGLLAITEAPEACFTYPGAGTSCFRVQRAAKGYMFRGAGLGVTYHASKIERGIKTCVASDLIG